MTVSEIETRAFKRLDDDPAAPATATSDELIAAINEGQELVAWLTLCLETEVNLTLPANASMIQIRGSFPDFLVPLRVELAGSRLQAVTLAGLDALDDQWQARTGAAAHYCTQGWNLMFVDKAAVNDTVAKFTYARAPVQMVGDDFPEIPEDYHSDLIDYALYRVRLKEGAQGLQRGLKYFNRFLDRVQLLGDFVRARSRAARYDTEPFELQLYDRSRLVKTLTEQTLRRKKT